MPRYTAKATDSKHFTLLKDEEVVGKLLYEKWYSVKALAELPNGATYDIEPKGFWGTSIEVSQGERRLMKIRFNFLGEITIETYFAATSTHYLLKTKSMFAKSFLLLNQEGQSIAEIVPNFTWKSLNYNYEMETTEDFELLPYADLMRIVMIHGTNYYMAMIMAAAV